MAGSDLVKRMASVPFYGGDGEDSGGGKVARVLFAGTHLRWRWEVDEGSTEEREVGEGKGTL